MFTTDSAVVGVSVTFFRHVAPTFGFMCALRGHNDGIRGADKMSISATIAITTLGVIRLPVALGAATGLNSNGI